MMQANETREYRLVALDMDGTLLNTEHATTPYTQNVIRQAANAGKIASISTGRCLSELWEHFEKLPGIRYVICENGACVYDIQEKRVIDQIALTHEQVLKVFEIASGFDLTKQFFRNNQSYMQCSDPEVLNKYHIYDFVGVFVNTAVFVDDLEKYYKDERGDIGKFNLYFAREEDKQLAKSMIEKQIPEIMLSDSIGVGLEVSPCGATKARGLKKLCEYLDLPIAASMAVGDSSNDLDIIRTAGLSVAMGNAIKEIRELADVITEDCDHDGAAKAIQRYMLGEKV